MSRLPLPVLALAASIAAAPLSAATLTDATRELLKAKNLSPEILDGLDEELKVPQAWIDGARKEGTVTMRMSGGQRAVDDMLKLFRARYPFVKLEYTPARGRELLIVPLLAFKQGTFVSDIVADFNGTQEQFAEAGALTPLKDLPGWNNVSDAFKRADGNAIGWKVAYYCTAYNKEKVKPADLPKTWEDFFSNPRWGNKTVGISSRPHLWLANLWGVYGDQWLTEYENKLFDVWKPQLRKESSSALTKLLTVNEFDLAFPIPEFAALTETKRGAPVGYHCPEPIPNQPGPLAILKGSPNPNGARLLVNWIVSKEGQIAASHYIGTTPSHKDLQRAEFLPFPDTMIGKKLAPQTAAVVARQGAIMADWDKRWLGAGGEKQGSED